jgi:hypothetical protein
MYFAGMMVMAGVGFTIPHGRKSKNKVKKYSDAKVVHIYVN